MQQTLEQSLEVCPLSPRELDVLAAIVDGLTNEQIGQMLFITKGTVKTHIRNIFAKLKVDDRTQAALWAVRSGVLK